MIFARTGVEALLEVVGVTIRSQRDVPGLRQPDVDLFLRHEPLDAAPLARE